MKGYTDFLSGFFGAAAIATKPIGKQKYIDWNKVLEVIKTHPNSVIYAGLMEDWEFTSGLIFAKGDYYDGYFFCTSNWATPILDVDDEEIECWTYEETESYNKLPEWLISDVELKSAYDYEEME